LVRDPEELFMICAVGFLVFAFLGIFSATYRKYTLDALSCMRNKASRQPCETGFDEQYKGWVVNNLMKVDLRLAGFVKDHFAAINWILFVAMIIMAGLTAESLYNLIVHGSCDPGAGCTVNQGLRWLK
jgi:hypothetical protein